MPTCAPQVRQACSGEWWVLHLLGLTVMTEGDADLDQHIARVVDAHGNVQSTHDRQAVVEGSGRRSRSVGA